MECMENNNILRIIIIWNSQTAMSIAGNALVTNGFYPSLKVTKIRFTNKHNNMIC